MFQKNWENRKVRLKQHGLHASTEGRKKVWGWVGCGGDWREDNSKWNCPEIYKRGGEVSMRGKGIFMNLGCIDSLLGALRSLCPLELCIGKTAHTGNLDWCFLLWNAVVKCLYFLRDPVLISWPTPRICSLGLRGSNTRLDFSGLGGTGGRVAWGERFVWFTCKSIVFLNSGEQMTWCLQSILA